MSGQGRAWFWVPGTYFAEGGPYAVVAAVSAVLFKSLGMTNSAMAFWTSLLMLPWAIKPLWTPVLDLFGTKRRWILAAQFAMTLLFTLAALLMPLAGMTRLLVAAFFFLAFASATHDAAVDGFYLIALDEHDQAFFAGIRGTFYRIATVLVQGALVMLAGWIESRTGEIRTGWCVALAVAAVVMGALSLWHCRVLPHPGADRPGQREPGRLSREFLDAFRSFFTRPGILPLLLFLLFFRVAEAQLGRIAIAFMQDPRSAGGLGMSVEEFGLLYGTFGTVALTAGGICGGLAVARWGFGRTLWPLVCTINLPDAVYVYLAEFQPQSLWIIGGCVAVEQFGYGLGYTAFMLVMVAAAESSGAYKTSHFAIMTGISILGLCLIGMISGRVQELLGFAGFFRYVMLCTIPGFLVTIPVSRRIPRDFGKKR